MLFILETCYNIYFSYLRGFLVDMLISWMKYQMNVISIALTIKVLRVLIDGGGVKH